MLKLSGRIEPVSVDDEHSRMLEITTRADLPQVVRQDYAFLGEPSANSFGFGAVLAPAEATEIAAQGNSRVYRLSRDYEYLKPGDIVKIDPRRNWMKVLFRANSKHNSILLTERCNHYCLMCSQPPKNVDDSALLEEAMELVERLPRSVVTLGFTGGEPTLYGEGLVRLIKATKRHIPETMIDVLTNGRAFSRKAYAEDVASVHHPYCMFGIPVYSDDSETHDYIVQSAGAFDETLKGILNLKRFKQRVEIRIVIHKQSLPRLVQTCEFLAKNFRFVDHVALMGLEITGFTRANLDLLWVDPWEYRDVLSEAAHLLAAYGVPVSVYNHQLCVVNADVKPYYRRSISDWKNEYVEECAECESRAECGGLFSSAVKYKRSAHLKPFTRERASV